MIECVTEEFAEKTANEVRRILKSKTLMLKMAGERMKQARKQKNKP